MKVIERQWPKERNFFLNFIKNYLLFNLTRWIKSVGAVPSFLCGTYFTRSVVKIPRYHKCSNTADAKLLSKVGTLI